MTVEKSPVSTIITDKVAVITIDYPPVNALGQLVRMGLMQAIEKLDADDNCKVIIIGCLGRTFIAGADIKEFGSPPLEPFLPQVVNRIEACSKPVIAALFGTTLGGGLEVALACHYRLALSTAKVGLPEVNLGLLPGAGGTQRLMRITGIQQAVEMICSGKHYPVTKIAESGLIDALFSADSDNPLNDLQQMSVVFAKQLIANNQLEVSPTGNRPVNAEDIDWQKLEINIKKKARGKIAPLTALNVIKQTWNMPIHEGMSVEREAFVELLASEQSAALRHAFAAEKKSSKLIDQNRTTLSEPIAEINQVGIIGGGTMGAGISTAFLSRGFEVVLIEQTTEAAKSAYQRIKGNFDNNIKRSRMSSEQVNICMSRLSYSADKHQLANCQLIIEAIFEDIDVKKALFKELDNICSDSCIFATNTSYLDINDIASASQHPERVLGMHFFSPANIMKLLEVVQADKTSAKTLAAAMNVGKKLQKIAVLVKVCFGFAGNRMYSRYGREIQQMLLEGASVEQIDKAMTDWGMAMGPLAVQDLSGIDIGYKARNSRPFPEHDHGYFKPATAMVEQDRLGRKTQLGFYRYDEKGQAHSDPEVARLISEQSAQLDITQRTLSDEEIVTRALFALISEGLQLFNERIVQRISDIDVIWLHGYGFPRYRGGPMFQAKQLGFEQVTRQLKQLQDEFGTDIWPDIDFDADILK